MAIVKTCLFQLKPVIRYTHQRRYTVRFALTCEGVIRSDTPFTSSAIKDSAVSSASLAALSTAVKF